jgi:hypothetical protein
VQVTWRHVRHAARAAQQEGCTLNEKLRVAGVTWSQQGIVIADCLGALRVLYLCTIAACVPELASCSMLANRALLVWSVLLLPDAMGVTCSACCTGIDTLWGLRRAAASRRRRGVAGLKASCSTNRFTCTQSTTRVS